MLPKFDFKISSLESELHTRLAHCDEALSRITAVNKPALLKFDPLVLPLQFAWHQLQRFIAPVRHLHAVANTPELRIVYDKCLNTLTAYETELSQNEALYDAYQSLCENPSYAELSKVQQRLIEETLKDFKLSGVHLALEKKARLKAIHLRLAELSTQFEHNVMDASDRFVFHTDNLSDLMGLPPAVLSAAAEKAKQKNMTGHSFGLDHPTYLSVLQECQNRETRALFYKAYQTRASDQDKNAAQFDNSLLMVEILKLRQEEAQLLGFSNFAELSLTNKMALSPQNVFSFIQNLFERGKVTAQKELVELLDFASAQGFQEPMMPWDFNFWSERLKQAKFDVSEETIKPYFPSETVLMGLLTFLTDLFGLTFHLKAASSWDPNVQVFELRDAADQAVGYLYVDLFVRAHKRGGAWMDDLQTRCLLEDGTIALPVASLTCNFSPPNSETPSLLTHEDVLTLFHEMGHCLHHLLSKVDYAKLSGVHGVAWDAIEFPSQFFENFAWQAEVIDRISGHVETGQKLPADLLAKLQRTEQFQAGIHLLKQIELAWFDLALHQDTHIQSAHDIHQHWLKVRAHTGLLPTPDFSRIEHSFEHIFSGGYAAGYYSYQWAEVLSADAFSRFETEGIFNAHTGAAFKKIILENGGSQAAMDLFVEFQGRAPCVDALLKRAGLLESKDNAPKLSP